jgi:DNA-binding transcriptional LysR family regulator
MPQSVEDLELHDIVLSTPMVRGQGGWLLRLGDKRLLISAQPRLQVNTVLGASDAIVSGAGLGLVPDFQARPLLTSGLLTRVLPGVDCDPVPVFAIYSGDDQASPAVRRLVGAALAGMGAVLRAGTPAANAEG